MLCQPGFLPLPPNFVAKSHSKSAGDKYRHFLIFLWRPWSGICRSKALPGVYSRHARASQALHTDFPLIAIKLMAKGIKNGHEYQVWSKLNKYWFQVSFFSRRGRKAYLANSQPRVWTLRTQLQRRSLFTLTVLPCSEAELGWDEPVPELEQH